MAAVHQLGFVSGILGPLTVSTWGSLSLAKFGYDRCSSFYNRNISIFGMFGWKMRIHTPKIKIRLFRRKTRYNSKTVQDRRIVSIKVE